MFKKDGLIRHSLSRQNLGQTQSIHHIEEVKIVVLVCEVIKSQVVMKIL